MMDVPQDPFLPDENAANFGQAANTLFNALLLGGMTEDRAASVVAKYIMELFTRAAQAEADVQEGQ